MRQAKFLLLTSLLALYFLFPNPKAAAAVGCDCGTLSGLLSRAAETVVSGIAGPVTLAIEKAAGYETSTLRQDLTAIREAILMAQERGAEAVELADQRAADRDAEKTYEPASQPITNCLNDQLGESWREAGPVRDVLREDLLKAATARTTRNAKPLDYLEEINAVSAVNQNLSRLLGTAPDSLTLSETEYASAGEVLGQLTDPLPAPTLPNGLDQSPAGKLYTAAKIDLDKRLGLYQGILAQRLASRAPSIDGLEEWAERKWGEMGGTGSPPGLVNGRLSENSLIWLLANVRLGSANWHEKVLPALPEAGLLRELAVMAATQLELTRRQTAHLDNISLMLALEGLDRLDQRARPALRNQYRLAVGARD
ncbi:MAG: hypothetical protein LBS60_02150 [Deltaproteobacteria bacterium]|jgi:hypothetical protein|nr:hypothetical protein [Deltaproteobacteria bacterium]